MIGTSPSSMPMDPQNEVARMPAAEFTLAMHKSLLDELGEAQSKGGRSGRAARVFLEEFSPHVDREEAELLPALEFLLEVEASGKRPPASVVAHLTHFLETGMARLEADHADLRRSLGGLRKVAAEDGDLRLLDIATRTAYLLGLVEETLFSAVVMGGAMLAASTEIGEGRAAAAATPPSGLTEAQPAEGTP